MEYYQTDSSEVIKQLDSDSEQGLLSEAISERKKKYGYNVLPDAKTPSLLSIFIQQFQNPLIYLLVGAAALIFICGNHKIDAFIISAVLLFNAILGTVQEVRTKNILESLKNFLTTDAIVLRDGKKIIINDTELVVGDIIFIKEGEKVPADARIIEFYNLKVDESILTGESFAVEKHSDALKEDLIIADRINMLFKGTLVLVGYAKAIVTHVGTETQIGKVHIATEGISIEMPLKKELDRLSHWIVISAIIMCILLFLVGWYTQKPLAELIVMLTALFICIVPEGLPVAFTLILVSGALRMAKKHMLVKNMQAVEALGRVDVILIDKTGTLTRNELMVARIWASDTMWKVSGYGYSLKGNIYLDNKLVKDSEIDPRIIEIARAASCLNRSEIIPVKDSDQSVIKGDPTEAALFVLSQKIYPNQEALLYGYNRIHEIEFSSELPFHAAFYHHQDHVIAYIIGSPDIITIRSRVTTHTSQMLEFILEDGFRVVATAMKIFHESEYDWEALTHQDYITLLDTDLLFLGFCAMNDTIRPEIFSAVNDARNAGISIVMVTGDHHKTALNIARSVGIFKSTDSYIDGRTFFRLSEEDRLKKLKKITVFSRVTAEQKMKIVSLFQQQHKIVAMTGDGINDAPSLAQADLGIAMGSMGTEVAKEASDAILLDDSFEYFVDAIEEGRHVFYTLKRVVLYFFSTNTAELFIVLFAFIYGLNTGNNIPLPLTAAQILWLNLITDGFLDVGLSMEPNEQSLIRKQRFLPITDHLIDGVLYSKMIFMALPMAIGSLYIFLSCYDQDLAYARTMTLVTMAMFQWFNVFNCRSARRSIFSDHLLKNRWLLIAAGFVLMLQLCVLYIPILNYVFSTVPLSLDDWYTVLSTSIIIIVLEECRKLFMRRIETV